MGVTAAFSQGLFSFAVACGDSDRRGGGEGEKCGQVFMRKDDSS